MVIRFAGFPSSACGKSLTKRAARRTYGGSLKRARAGLKGMLRALAKKISTVFALILGVREET